MNLLFIIIHHFLLLLSKCFTRAGSEAKSPPTTRVRRNTRASSIEPEAMTSSKFIDKQNELASTPIKTRRRASILPSEATVLEEKECKKIAVVTLDRTLSNVIEIKETGIYYILEIYLSFKKI